MYGALKLRKLWAQCTQVLQRVGEVVGCSAVGKACGDADGDQYELIARDGETGGASRALKLVCRQTVKAGGRRARQGQALVIKGSRVVQYDASVTVQAWMSLCFLAR